MVLGNYCRKWSGVIALSNVSLCLCLIGLIGVSVIWYLGRSSIHMGEKVYRIGVPNYWGTINPPLQHTLVGDAIIEYQFNPLIRIGERGVIVPLAAKTWEFSSDKRILRFKINTDLRFSDGSFLTAADVKRSWEDGLRLVPFSSNSSLADGLANVHGYSDFPQAGTISGIRVLNADTLELWFDSPARQALRYLAGGRFSVYKLLNGSPIGTGPYMITEREQVLTLRLNPYYVGQAPSLKNVRITVVPVSDALNKLQGKEIDALLIADMLNLPGCDEGKLEPIRCASGQEGLHWIINLNGLNGRFFSNPEYRLAFQALIWKYISHVSAALKGRGFVSDPQSFLRFQPGRLSDAEAQEIISSGETYIPAFIAAVRKHPLYLVAGPIWNWLPEVLQKEGVALAVQSRCDMGAKDFWEMYYKTFTPDIMPMGASVADGDPDVLYHLLGAHGAIASPIARREQVCKGIEGGRQLLDQSVLPLYYENVARNILREVPYIHLGYLNRRVVYNSERLVLKDELIGRHNLSILDFTPR